MRYSKSEWASRIGSLDFEEELARAIRTSGYFILESVLDPGLISELYDAFILELEKSKRDGDTSRGVNRFNTQLFVDGVFANEEIVANPIVMPLIRRMLGVDAACAWAAGDTPLPGSDYQAVHSDGRPLFRKHDLSLPAYALAVNFPLVDFTLDNGPMEIWPYGTHLFSEIKPTVGAANREPVPVLMPAGSLLCRDTRLWHRGTPNHGAAPRPNLAFVYCRSWYRFEGEAGELSPTVSEEAYKAWGTDAQQVFRFARLDPEVTKARRIELLLNVEKMEDEFAKRSQSLESIANS